MTNTVIFFLFLCSNLFIIRSDALVTLIEKEITTPDSEGKVLYMTEESVFLEDLHIDFILKSMTQTLSKNFGIILQDLTTEELVIYLSSATKNGAKVYAKAFSVNGHCNSDIELFSEHSYLISNNTNEVQKYRIELGLETHDKKFQKKEYFYYLSPGEIETRFIKMNLIKYYSLQNDYPVFAFTNVILDVSNIATDLSTVVVR